MFSPAVLLPILAISWLIARKARSPLARQLCYLAASYLFYFSLAGWFIGILLISTLFNYYWGGILRTRQTGATLWTGIAANVALLGAFKYAPALLAPWAGSSNVAGTLAGLALPVGISFWTFQALSYLFDQFRGEDLNPSLAEFALYMSFAPTVLSGPICRVGDLLPQFRGPFRGDWSSIRAGAQSIWAGAGLIALGRILGSGFSGQGVNWAFGHPEMFGGAGVWLMLIGYGFQLLFDFSGYSRLVIGIARVYGVHLPENFDRPYLAPNPTVFWQRWHMSLSFWIRDYVFIPAAMVRREIWWRNSALVASMAVFGIWHKGSLLFLIWGIYQGVLLLCHRLWQQRCRWSVPTGVSWLATFACINLGWVFFRAADLQQAKVLLSAALLPFAHAGASTPYGFRALVLAAAAGYFVWHFLAARFGGENPKEGVLQWIPVEGRFALYAVIFYLAVFRSAEPQAFIYSQF